MEGDKNTTQRNAKNTQRKRKNDQNEEKTSRIEIERQGMEVGTHVIRGKNTHNNAKNKIKPKIDTVEVKTCIIKVKAHEIQK